MGCTITAFAIDGKGAAPGQSSRNQRVCAKVRSARGRIKVRVGFRSSRGPPGPADVMPSHVHSLSSISERKWTIWGRADAHIRPGSRVTVILTAGAYTDSVPTPVSIEPNYASVGHEIDGNLSAPVASGFICGCCRGGTSRKGPLESPVSAQELMLRFCWIRRTLIHNLT